jgi:hypothetical protein
VIEPEQASMRQPLILFCLLCGAVTPAVAQVSIGVGLPHVQIGINLPVYPQFVQVPNYPVYYAPQLDANYFFYDGMYWAYDQDNWYASTWYNGPWSMVSPRYVPVYVLRVPVRYYRRPPRYFHEWAPNDPPRWGDHWGRDWEHQRTGWNEWNRNSAPPPAPLPSYQRQYSGNRYPHVEQQPAIHGQNYRYRPSDPVVKQYYQQVPPKQQQQRPQQAQPQQQPQSQDHGQQGQGQGGAKEDKPGKGNGKGNGKGDGKGDGKDTDPAEGQGQQPHP